MAVKIRGVVKNAARKTKVGKTTPKRPDAPDGSGQVLLFCPGVATVRLPYWPDEISRAGLTRDWVETPRSGRRPLLLSAGRTLDSYDLGFVVRNGVWGTSIKDWIDALELVAASDVPVSLVMARSTRGLFQITDLSLIEVDAAGSGNPATVDVSMTLKRASDATVSVGPVKRKRNVKPKDVKGSVRNASR